MESHKEQSGNQMTSGEGQWNRIKNNQAIRLQQYGLSILLVVTRVMLNDREGQRLQTRSGGMSTQKSNLIVSSSICGFFVNMGFLLRQGDSKVARLASAKFTFMNC